jgi:hypothetical protein
MASVKKKALYNYINYKIYRVYQNSTDKLSGLIL